ncbi:YbaB/EbfC family nucleoid-associated protein [Streptomyces sp. NPDC029004]|uniref:YbaB/EbfC family nucleoid-associated protein n=1 Tax=Streptomyces sp. NPDC029004 TaxID=3154490 RepID=UPI0033E41620
MRWLHDVLLDVSESVWQDNIKKVRYKVTSTGRMGTSGHHEVKFDGFNGGYLDWGAVTTVSTNLSQQYASDKAEQKAEQAEQEAKQEQRQAEQEAKQEQRQAEAENRHDQQRREALSPGGREWELPFDGPDTTPGSDGGLTSLNPDGSVTTRFPDGSFTTVDPATGETTVGLPDGTHQISDLAPGESLHNKDGSWTTLNPDHSLTTDFPDGSSSTVDPAKGTTTTTFPDGSSVTSPLEPGHSLPSHPGNPYQTGPAAPSSYFPNYEEELFDTLPDYSDDLGSPLTPAGLAGTRIPITKGTAHPAGAAARCYRWAPASMARPAGAATANGCATCRTTGSSPSGAGFRHQVVPIAPRTRKWVPPDAAGRRPPARGHPSCRWEAPAPAASRRRRAATARGSRGSPRTRTYGARTRAGLPPFSGGTDMTESMQERLASAMAELKRTQVAVAQAEESLRAAATKVRSRDRSVEVTVGPQGELTHIRFLDGKYRNMGSAQLSAAVLDAVQEGRAQMARLVLDAFQPLSERSRGLPEVTGSEIDWERIFGPLQATAAEGTPGRTGGGRLRDEIHEDADESGPRSPGRAIRGHAEGR